MLGSQARHSAPGSRSASSRDAAGQAIELLRDYEQVRPGLVLVDRCRRPDRLYFPECRGSNWARPAASLAGQPFHSLFILERDELDQVERTLPLIFSGHKTFPNCRSAPPPKAQEVWWAISGRPQFSSWRRIHRVLRQWNRYHCQPHLPARCLAAGPVRFADRPVQPSQHEQAADHVHPDRLQGGSSAAAH